MSAEYYRQTIEQPSDRVIVALDNMNWSRAEEIMAEVGDYVGLAKANSIAQKLGWEDAIDRIASFGAYTMADAKYKDIPETMKNHLREIAECGPQFVTVHASNTSEALEQAMIGKNIGMETQARSVGYQEAVSNGRRTRTALLGVTVLTSIGVEECISIYGDPPERKVLEFARKAAEIGIEGIVCSGKELKAIRANSVFDGLLTVVPGITPAWATKAGDQKRVVTPTEALQEGADYIVVGRAITQPPEGVSPAEAAQRIAEELAEAA